MSATAARVNGNGNGRRAPRPRAVPAVEPTGPQSLDAALLEFSKQAPRLTRDAVGQIQNRTYGYVTLDALLDAVVKLLIDLELIWRTYPTTDKHGQPALRYRITHVPSGDQDEDVMPLMCARPDPQGQGSALTYARRYALLAYLNLAPGDDDDGAAGSQPDQPASSTTSASSPSSPQPAGRPPAGGDRPASAAQKKMLRRKAEDAQLTAAQFANVLLVANGEPERDWDAHAAERWLGRALDRLAGQRVDAVILGIERSRA